MARRADVQMEIAPQRRAGSERVAAAARDGDLLILWVNLGFHVPISVILPRT